MGDDKLATTIAEAADLSEAVHLALGEASTCWDNLAGAGVFQSERAREIALELEAWIEQHKPGRSLGTVFVDVVPRIVQPTAAELEASTVELEGGPVPNVEDLRIAGSLFAEAGRAPAAEVDRRWRDLCDGLHAFVSAFRADDAGAAE